MRKIAQETATETQQPTAISTWSFFCSKLPASPWDMVRRKDEDSFSWRVIHDYAIAPRSDVILGNESDDQMTC